VYGNEEHEQQNILDGLTFWYPELDHNARNHEAMCRLAWRRAIIADQCHNDWRTFARIYPSSPEAAFATENKCVFATAILADERQILTDDPPHRTNKDFNYNASRSRGYNIDWWKAAFDLRPHGPLEVFEEPMPDVRYVIGADPSYGIDQSDSSAAVVLRVPELVEVATFNASVAPSDFAELLYALGFVYNIALIGCESNSVGYATQEPLMKRLHYPKLYLRRKYNTKPGVETGDDFGWWTDKNNKEAMISELRDAVNHRSLMLNSMRTLSQLETYRKLPSGKLGAAPTKHDDLVMALAIAFQMTKQIPRTAKERTTTQKGDYGTIGWWEKQGGGATGNYRRNPVQYN
jgi:hypothetical protein